MSFVEHLIVLSRFVSEFGREQAQTPEKGKGGPSLLSIIELLTGFIVCYTELIALSFILLPLFPVVA